MPTKPLIWLAIALNTTSAQMPMVMPRMVRLDRSFRRESSRSCRIVVLLRARRLQHHHRGLARAARGEAIEVVAPAGEIREPGPQALAFGARGGPCAHGTGSIAQVHA